MNLPARVRQEPPVLVPKVIRVKLTTKLTVMLMVKVMVRVKVDTERPSVQAQCPESRAIEVEATALGGPAALTCRLEVCVSRGNMADIGKSVSSSALVLGPRSSVFSLQSRRV